MNDEFVSNSKVPRQDLSHLNNASPRSSFPVNCSVEGHFLSKNAVSETQKRILEIYASLGEKALHCLL
jgi:hypothetical protein